MKNSPKWCRFHLKVLLQYPCDITGGESDYRSHRDAGNLTDFLCWFSRADAEIVLRGCVFPCSCVSAEAEGHKKHLPIIFFPLLNVAPLTNLAACLAVKRVNRPRLIRTLCRQLLLLLCFFSFCFSLGCCCFFSALIFSTSPLRSGLSAHTALHKLNSPLFKLWQAFSVWICITRLHSSRGGGGGEAAIPETAVT